MMLTQNQYTSLQRDSAKDSRGQSCCMKKIKMTATRLNYSRKLPIYLFLQFSARDNVPLPVEVDLRIIAVL